MGKRERPKAWEQQEGESARAYQAFFEYAKMGADRSLVKVWQKLGKSKTIITRWSSKWAWTKRAQEYDAYLHKTEIDAQKAEIRRMAKETITIAQSLKKKALQALIELESDQLTPTHILCYIDKGVELEKQARQEWLMYEEKQSRQAQEGDESNNGVVIYLPEKEQEPEEDD